MTDIISYAALKQTTEHHLGTSDIPCPLCGPDRRSENNRRRKVLRVWHIAPGFMTYSCARCGARGYARAQRAVHLHQERVAEARVEEQQAAAATSAAKRDNARWLWSRRQLIEGTPAEIYLREARGYGGPLPATIGFLPGHGEYPPAMIGAFGLIDEREPGIISISDEAVAGIHLTRLAPDGAGKAGTDADKIMIGTPLGSPIVLAMPGDLAGLAIAEGIEDALSVHEATGLGVWVAGAASFMPALAAAVPGWIECVTILVDDDSAGRTNADALAERLECRGF
jgi:Toprim domain-containing protein